jgi:iron complex transport system substrate-binding protein
MRKQLLPSLLALSLMGLVACNSKSPEIAGTGQYDLARVVCASKQLNEMIFALGAGSHVVGTDLTSVYPPEIRTLPKVGYHRLLNVEGIISLKPTLVIHDGNVAPTAVLDQLHQVGIPVQKLPESHTIDETKDLMRTIGKEFGAEARADSLCAKLDADMARVKAKLADYPDRPKVMLIHYGQQMNNYLVVSASSTAGEMIEWAGGTNAGTSEKGMKPLSPEIVADAQPDVIFATDVGFDKMGGIENFKKLPGVALTPAAQNNRIYRLDEHDIIYLGPGTGENVLKLMEMIHRK